VVEDRGLHSAREERVRLAGEELVESVVGGDQLGEPSPPSSGTSPLLAERGDGARKPDRDRAVEEADVDAELERVGCRDPEQLACDESPLDLASLLGRVPGPVGGEPAGDLGVEALDGEAVDELCGPTALREADRPQPAGDEGREEAGGVTERARAQAEVDVEERRVPDRDLTFRTRSSPGFAIVADARRNRGVAP
jgi:hypothetical protein